MKFIEDIKIKAKLAGSVVVAWAVLVLLLLIYIAVRVS